MARKTPGWGVPSPPPLEPVHDPDAPLMLPVSSRAGRRRRSSLQVRAAILEAAGRLLLAEGMRSFTIERVAALAGAGKMTIYKWWPSKGTLALEGYTSTIVGYRSAADTGDVERDLHTQLLAYVHLLRDTRAGRVLAELLGETQADPALAAAFHESYSMPRRAAGVKLLRLAQERGQIRADADPEVLIDQLWGACLYRLFMHDYPLSDEFAHAVVRNILEGIRPVAVPPASSESTNHSSTGGVEQLDPD